ncbi:MFS transporter [Amycolatopsis pithecellobii]|uniref:MFS transporter n=1 Tax=Amycolatopsis pithecellobii TaxID=664692 RepID=A0A6N7Z4W5_9PSEU|nr:MFS transporter [Amycolatopsis pithecellobii]MTD54346.1 MFS transporter [Amycolatopsis pithecellobii]
MDVHGEPLSPPGRDTAILARLERLDITKPLRRLRFQAGLGYAFDAADTATLALILPAVSVVWHLNKGQTGVLGSSVLIGFMFGALASGAIGDAFGRRRVMTYALLLFCLGSLLGALAPNWELLFAARVVTGLGCGAEAAVISVYASEFVAARHRGRFVGSLVAFFALGWIIAALAGRFVIPLDGGWRWLQVLGATPVLLLLWWRRYLPESPRWLLLRGRRREAHEVVARFERGSGLEPGPAPGVDDMSVPRPRLQIRGGLRSLRGFADLLQPGLRRVTLSTCFLWLVVFFCFYGFNTWIPSLLIARGYTITSSFTFTILIYVAQAPGYYSAARLFARFDQKTVIVGYFVGGAISAFILSQVSTTATILAASCLLSFFMSGVSGCTYAYTPQVFPTAIRSSGSGLCSAVGRVGAIAAPIVVGTSYSALGFGGVFALFMGMLVIGGLGVLVFGVATRNKTLEEIEAEELGTVVSLPVDEVPGTAAPRDRRVTSGEDAS